MGLAAGQPATRGKRVLCVFSEQQREEFEADYASAQLQGVDFIFPESPEDALDEFEAIDPGLVLIGMELGHLEGLEFLAMLMNRYRSFSHRIIVLPNRGDPFPPMLQWRNPETGRSVTEETSIESIGNLIRTLHSSLPQAPREREREPRQRAAAAPPANSEEFGSVDDMLNSIPAGPPGPDNDFEVASVPRAPALPTVIPEHPPAASGAQASLTLPAPRGPNQAASHKEPTGQHPVKAPPTGFRITEEWAPRVTAKRMPKVTLENAPSPALLGAAGQRLLDGQPGDLDAAPRSQNALTPDTNVTARKMPAQLDANVTARRMPAHLDWNVTARGVPAQPAADSDSPQARVVESAMKLDVKISALTPRAAPKVTDTETSAAPVTDPPPSPLPAEPFSSANTPEAVVAHPPPRVTDSKAAAPQEASDKPDATAGPTAPPSPFAHTQLPGSDLVPPEPAVPKAEPTPAPATTTAEVDLASGSAEQDPLPADPLPSNAATPAPQVQASATEDAAEVHPSTESSAAAANETWDQRFGSPQAKLVAALVGGMVVLLLAWSLLSGDDDHAVRAAQSTSSSPAKAEALPATEPEPSGAPRPAAAQPAPEGEASEHAAPEATKSKANHNDPKDPPPEAIDDSSSGRQSARPTRAVTTLPLRFRKASHRFRVANPELLTVTLTDFAQALRAHPGTFLEVGGHASKEGQRSYNRDLGERRATAVRKLLVERGFPADRIVTKNYQHSLSQGDEGHSSDRRVTLRLLDSAPEQ